jgi:hypothetical protein
MQHTNEQLNNEIRLANEYGLGYDILTQLYHKSPNTLQSIIGKGKSPNHYDVFLDSNRVYSELIKDCDIDYFIDGTRAKLKPLWTHNHMTVNNSPNLMFIADKRGKLIEFMLFNTKDEYAFNYEQIVIKANLPKGCVIHVDIYSLKLFNALESRGYIVCHKNKSFREFPFYTKIEHLFSNIQKGLRQFNERQKVNSLSKIELNRLIVALVMAYHYKQKSNFIELITELKAKSQPKLEVRVKC